MEAEYMSLILFDEALITLMESALHGEKISAATCEEICKNLDKLKIHIQMASTSTPEDHARWKREDEAKLLALEFDGEWCDTCEHTLPGIIFPIAADENDAYAWVQRCGTCEVIETDVEAAHIVGRMLGLEVGMAWRGGSSAAAPHLRGVTFDQAIDLWNNLQTKVHAVAKVAQEMREQNEHKEILGEAYDEETVKEAYGE